LTAEAWRISHIAVHGPDHYRNAKSVHQTWQARSDRRTLVNDLDSELLDQQSRNSALLKLRNEVDKPVTRETPDVGRQNPAKFPANLLKRHIRNIVNAGGAAAQRLVEFGF
jgi:hypothetical protein